MDLIRILIVAPYKGLDEVFERSCKDFPNLNPDIITGNWESVRNDLAVLDMGQYDLIISRGGMAKRMRSAYQLPVLELEVSPFDILRVLKNAQQTGKSFAVVGYSNITKSVSDLCEILQYTVPIYPVNNQDQAGALLAQLQAQGTELVIGDIMTSTIARRIGVNCLLLTSGYESVEKALNSAQSLMDSFAKLERKRVPFQDICHHADYGIVVLDEAGYLLYSNPVLADWSRQELEKFFQAPRQMLEGKSSLHLRKTRNNIAYDLCGLSNRNPHQRCYIFYVRKRTQKLRSESHAKWEVFSQDDLQFDSLLVGTKLCQDAQTMASASNFSATPLLLCASAGAQCHLLAKWLHLMSDYASSLFVTIDCQAMHDTRWAEFITSHNSLLNAAHCTLYFQNIQSLSLEKQRALAEYIDQAMLWKRNFLLCSAPTPLVDAVERGAFSYHLYTMLCANCLPIVPLRKRPGDVSTLANLFVSRYNLKHAKQIVGFDQDALALLTAHDWPLDVLQLEHLVSKLVLSTHTAYIKADAVSLALAQSSGAPAVQGATLDLTKPMAHIEQQIYAHVLNEERGNLSKAAKRLQIGRSTLWRKLGKETQ